MKAILAGFLLITGLAHAEMSDEVRVQGTVGDFDQEKVSLEFQSGVMVIIPRDSVVGVRDLRPGKRIIAYPKHKKIKIKRGARKSRSIKKRSSN